MDCFGISCAAGNRIREGVHVLCDPGRRHVSWHSHGPSDGDLLQHGGFVQPLAAQTSRLHLRLRLGPRHTSGNRGTAYPECLFYWANLLPRRDGRLTATHKDSSLGTVTAAELGQDVAHVRINGALGYEQPLGNLPVCQAPGDKLRDLMFALGERDVLLRV